MTLTRLICTTVNGKEHYDRDTPANRRKHAALRKDNDCVTRIGSNDGFLFVVDEMLYSRKRVERMQQKADADLKAARASGYAYSIEACERRKRAADLAEAALIARKEA